MISSGRRWDEATFLRFVGAWATLLPVGALGCAERLDFFVPSPPSPGTEVIEGVPKPPEPTALQVSTHFNISTDNSGQRDCLDGGDAVQYQVAGISSKVVSLDRAPARGCLTAGDEVFLAAVQGSALSSENVGSYELLRVFSVSGSKVTLVSAATAFYGESAGKNDGLTERAVVLVRVPSYSRLIIAAGATLEASPFDGSLGGVLVARSVGDLVVDGEITMSGRGYRGGAETREVEQTGLSGESVRGLGRREVTPNDGGGGGGLADQTTNACVQDGNAGGGGAHVDGGASAVVFDLCSAAGAGLGGVAYAEQRKLFLGSGGGAGGTDNVLVDNPFGGHGGAGGGMIWLLAQSVSGAGSISAEGEDGAGDPEDVECATGGSTTSCYDHSGPGGAGAGGSIRISAKLLEGVVLLAGGGRGGNGNDPSTGDAGDGSAGLVLVD